MVEVRLAACRGDSTVDDEVVASDVRGVVGRQNEIAAAISAGCAGRPMGTCRSYSSPKRSRIRASIGVATPPEQTELTRTPSGA